MCAKKNRPKSLLAVSPLEGVVPVVQRYPLGVDMRVRFRSRIEDHRGHQQRQPT